MIKLFFSSLYNDSQLNLFDVFESIPLWCIYYIVYVLLVKSLPRAYVHICDFGSLQSEDKKCNDGDDVLFLSIYDFNISDECVTVRD